MRKDVFLEWETVGHVYHPEGRQGNWQADSSGDPGHRRGMGFADGEGLFPPRGWGEGRKRKGTCSPCASTGGRCWWGLLVNPVFEAGSKVAGGG